METSKTKQTTIGIKIEEMLIGARVLPFVPHSRFLTDNPRAAHADAWGLVSKLPWYRGQDIEPKNVEDCASPDWYRALSERITRVLNNRPYHATVTVLETCAAGWAVKWKVCVHWNKPRKPLNDDPKGIWTLREYASPTSRPRIIAKITAPLGCDGDELYDHLPDGFPDGYESECCEPGRVDVFNHNTDTGKLWTFTFKRTRQDSAM